MTDIEEEKESKRIGTAPKVISAAVFGVLAGAGIVPPEMAVALKELFSVVLPFLQ